MGVKAQRVTRLDGTTTYTVIGPDYLPIPPVAEYLDFLRVDGASPNTIRSYATGLASWFDYLHLTGGDWTNFKALDVGHWVTWLRTGDLPETSRIGTPPRLLSPATLQARNAAVLAFYRYQYAANGLEKPYRALYSPVAKRGRRPNPNYVGFLAGIDRRTITPSPVLRVKAGPKDRTPLLTPAQVQTILDGCCTQRADGSWTGTMSSLRDRLYFAVLAETGMRPGEALTLRHTDFRLGQGTQPCIHLTPHTQHPHGYRVKSGQPRRVYVGDDLEGLYAEYVWRLVDAGADMRVDDFPSSFVFVNSDTSRGVAFKPLRIETVYATVRALKHHHPTVLPAGWTPHWLRHTHATALLLSGCPPHVVMRRLGHLDVQTTLGTYGWVTEDAELRAVADWKYFATGWKEHLTA